MVAAAESSREDYKILSCRIRGFLFYGTPHSGADIAKLGYSVTKAIQIFLPQVSFTRVNCEYLRLLQRDNSVLDRVGHSFRQCAQRFDIKVVSVIETRAMSLFKGPVNNMP